MLAYELFLLYFNTMKERITILLLVSLSVFSVEIIDIAAGFDHSLALDESGNVWGWGSNSFGQLGLGDTLQRHEPVMIDGLSNIADVSAGYCFSVALSEGGQIFTWGLNDQGQLGDGSTENRWTPVNVRYGGGFLSGISGISAGAEHTMAVTTAGEIYLWGSNIFGQLGIGSAGGFEILPVTPWGSDWERVEAGAGFSLAVRGDSLLSWGSGESGQLSNDTTLSRNTPEYALNSDGMGVITGIADIAASKFGIFWSNGHVLCDYGTDIHAWGRNSYGQLGIGTEDRISLPSDVLDPDGDSSFGSILDISAGKEHSAIISSDGLVWSMGDNYYGMLGNPYYSESSLPVPVLSDGSQLTEGHIISCGGNFTMILTDSGLYATGLNNRGQLGDGTTGIRTQAVQITFIPLEVEEEHAIYESISLSLHPNPFNSTTNIETTPGAYIQIFDIIGNLVAEGESYGIFVWNPDLPSGVYHVTATQDGKRATLKAVLIR